MFRKNGIGLVLALTALCVVPRSLSQSLILSKKPLSFFSQRDHTFKVINDSNLYILHAGKEWEKVRIHFPSEIKPADLEYYYFPISNANKDLIVSRGCGLVYELLNDTLIRLDRSFDHKNQYYGAIFSHQNRLCFFGGYGLFTSKNIITYFDPNLGEWLLQMTKGELPEPRDFMYYKKCKNALYIFGGNQAKNNIGRPINNAWRYDFNAQQWRLLGTLNPELNEVFNKGERMEYTCSPFIKYGPRLFHYFPEKNQIIEFNSDAFSRLSAIILGKGDRALSVIALELNKFQIKPIHLAAFLGKPKRVYPIFVKEGFKWWWAVALLGIVFCTLLFFLFRKRPIRRSGEEFNELDRAFMELLSSNGEEGIENTELNHLLDDGQANFETLKKRRELKLRELRTKLSHFSGLSPDEVILEKRLDTDRRVKRLYLNPTIKWRK